MGLLLLVSLPPEAGTTIYRCNHCAAHIAYHTDVISKLFRCKHGKAYLLQNIVNVAVDTHKEDRMMTTGVHTVSDIFCVGCGSNLGWKYLTAFDRNQRYKEGKFILDRSKVLPPAGGADGHHGHGEQQNQDSSDEEDDQQDQDAI